MNSFQQKNGASGNLSSISKYLWTLDGRFAHFACIYFLNLPGSMMFIHFFPLAVPSCVFLFNRVLYSSIFVYSGFHYFQVHKIQFNHWIEVIHLWNKNNRISYFRMTYKIIWKITPRTKLPGYVIVSKISLSWNLDCNFSPQSRFKAVRLFHLDFHIK